MRNNSVPPDIQVFFGDPPLLSTEDPNLYWGMFDRFAEFVDPTNIMEWFWVKDIVDLCWEITRLRRYRAQQIENARCQKIPAVEYVREHADGRDLCWMDKLRLPQAQIEAGRNAPRLDTEAGSAGLLILEHLDTYETIDKLLMAAELRRDRILRELDIRRERIAPRLREASTELIDAPSETVLLASE